MQRVHTAYGPGVVVAEETVHGRTQYRVEGEGFAIWAFGNDLVWDELGHEVDYENSTTLPYNPRPQHPSDVFRGNDLDLGPGTALDPSRRLTPADSVTFEDRSGPDYPGPSADLFAGPRDGNDTYRTPQDVWPDAVLSSTASIWDVPPASDKHVRVARPVDPDSPQAQLDRDPVLFARVKAAEWHTDAPDIETTAATYLGLLETDAELRTAAWKDVRAKAVRLRRSGALDVMAANKQAIYGQVQGDHGRYETIVVRGSAYTGSNSITEWSCTCKWGQWAFQRQMTYVGRLCSHAYSMYLELQGLARRKDTSGTPFAAGREAARGHFDVEIEETDGFAGQKEYFVYCDGQLVFETRRSGVFSQSTAEMIAEKYRNATDYTTLDGAVFVADRRRQAQGDMANNVPGDSTDDYDATVDGVGDFAAPLPAADSTEAYDPTVQSARHPDPDGGLSTAPGTLGFDEHHIPFDPQRTRHDVDGGRGLIAWPGVLGVRAALEDIESVADPADDALLRQLRALVDENERPQHNRARSREMQALIRELRHRGYNADNLTASLAVQADFPTPGGHEPFAGSGPDPRTSWSSSADYVNATERPYDHVDAHTPGIDPNPVESDPPRDFATAATRDELKQLPKGVQDIGYLADYYGEESKAVDKALHGAVEEPEGDHGFRQASLADIQSWASADDTTADALRQGGGGAPVTADDPALAMFTPPTRTAAEDTPDTGPAWLLGGSGGGGADEGGPFDFAAAAQERQRVAGRQYSIAEQQALIEEASADGAPVPREELDLRGTHYLP